MELFDYIQRQVAGMHRQVSMTLKDITPEQFSWAPPGTANTISATYVHMISVEDHFIQGFLQGKPRLWEVDGWGERTGVKKTPDIGESWDEFKHLSLSLAAFAGYQQSVWAATDAYLAQLKPEDLDRKLPFAGREATVAEMLLLVFSQELSHAGEIAALKGIQGAKGLPI